jgi:hypothetical protein
VVAVHSFHTLVPLGEVIKHDITSDTNMHGAWVISVVGLGPRPVPYEHYHCAPFFKLSQVRLGVLDVDNAAKGS